MRLFKIAISCLILFSALACEKFQDENNKNELSVTGHAEDISGISATLICYANFTDNVFGDVTVGVQVSESESFNGGTGGTVPEVGKDGKYSITVNGLKVNTKYFFRSYVCQNKNYHYGEAKSFTTKAESIISTSDAYSVSPISARVKLELNESYNSLYRMNLLYFGYTTTPDSDYSWKEAKKVDDYYKICGLTPGTTYYFRGSIYVGDQRYVSDIKSFTTTQKEISVSIESTTVDNNTATISGKVSGLEDCDYSSIALTVYYDHGPEISAWTKKAGAAINGNSWTLSIPSLEAGTEYDVTPILTIDGNEYHGEVGHFNVPKKIATAIDLGLSVKWAEWNLGATAPEEYGAYYAWGETAPKTTYEESNYVHANGSLKSLTKYCKTSEFGTVDNKTRLEKSDDAAYVQWGEGWRIPTQKEFSELLENCTVTNEQINGVYVKKFASRKNGKSIVLPSAGLYGKFHENGYYGYYYWTSDLWYGDSMCAYFYDSKAVTAGAGRSVGYSIRPVYK